MSAAATPPHGRLWQLGQSRSARRLEVPPCSPHLGSNVWECSAAVEDGAYRPPVSRSPGVFEYFQQLLPVARVTGLVHAAQRAGLRGMHTDGGIMEFCNQRAAIRTRLATCVVTLS